MKRRPLLPLHLFILFATLLAAGGCCPRADAHEPEKGAFRHAPTQYETVIQDVYQPLLIQTEVRVPHVRGHELSQKDNDAPVYDAGQDVYKRQTQVMPSTCSPKSAGRNSQP